VLRRQLLFVAVAVVLGEVARRLLASPEPPERIGGARHVPRLQEELGRRLLAPGPQRDVGRRSEASALLEDGLGAVGELCALIEAAGHRHELAPLGGLLRIAPHIAELVPDRLLEAGGGLLPLLARRVGLRSLAREAGLRVGLRGPAEVPALLVHLAGDAQIPGLLVGLPGAPELALLAEDAAGGLVLARLEVELGRLDEAVLVVADLRRALELLVLDEVSRRLLEEAAREAVLRRFGVPARLRQGAGLLGGLLPGLGVDVDGGLPFRDLPVLFLRCGGRAAAGKEHRDRQHQPPRHEAVKHEHVGEERIHAAGEVAGHPGQ
jgi:hypothetical protein